MNIEKLKQIQQLVSECINEYQSDETSEGPEHESMEGENDSLDSSSSSVGSGGSDKIKMAVAMMKKGSK